MPVSDLKLSLAKIGGLAATFAYNASSVDARMFTARTAIKILAIKFAIDTAATDGGGASVIVRKCPSLTVITSGTALCSLIDLTTVAATSGSAVLSTTPGALNLQAGDSIALDFTGTLTAAVGVITVYYVPA